MEIDANYANAMWFMALSLEKKGQLADTVLLLQRAVEASGGGMHYKALLSRAYALAGERRKSSAMLADLEALTATDYVSPFDLAVANFGLETCMRGFQLLEEAFSQRVFRLIELTWPMFDDIRSDPRCEAIVRRIGL